MTVHAEPVAAFVILTQTNTHYAFGEGNPAGQPMEGPSINPGSGFNSPATSPDVLGLGFGFDFHESDSFHLLDGRGRAVGGPESPEPGARSGEAWQEAPSTTAAADQVPPVPPIEAVVVIVSTSSTTISPPHTPLSTSDDPVSPPRKTTPITQSKPVSNPASTAPRTTVVTSLSTTTVTTTGTRTTPSASASISTPSGASLGSVGLRRRSSSEGEDSRGATARPSQDRDRLFRVRQIVATKSKIFAQNLDAILQRVKDTEGRTHQWLEGELRICQDQLDRMEELESTSWVWIASVESKGRPTSSN